MLWLKGGSTSKDHDCTFMKLQAISRCGDPKFLANAMTSHMGAKDPNTNNCNLERYELFGSTNWKFDLSLVVDCDPTK